MYMPISALLIYCSCAILSTPGDNKEWNAFLHEWSQRWMQSFLSVARYQQLHPVLRVLYEDLKSNTTNELERMLQFLHVPLSNAQLQPHQGGDSGLEKLHRQANHSFDPFTEQQRKTLRSMMTHLKDKLEVKGYRDSIDYVNKYLLTCT